MPDADQLTAEEVGALDPVKRSTAGGSCGKAWWGSWIQQLVGWLAVIARQRAEATVSIKWIGTDQDWNPWQQNTILVFAMEHIHVG